MYDCETSSVQVQTVWAQVEPPQVSNSSEMRPVQKPILEKACAICSKTITKSYQSRRVWEERTRFCSNTCRGKAGLLRGRKQTPEHVSKRTAGQVGRRHTLETRKRLSTIWREKLNGYVSPKFFRNCLEYKLWRSEVFQRDDYTCQMCRARSGKGVTVKLEADHIKPFAAFPELRFDVSNGRTLCKPCHRRTPTYGRTKKKAVQELAQ